MVKYAFKPEQFARHSANAKNLLSIGTSMNSVNNIRLTIAHSLNPLHIYCRLVGIGVNSKVGLAVIRYYEKTVFRVVVWLLRE